VQPGPYAYSLLDLIMAGGCLGLCTLSWVPIGIIASLVALRTAQWRRTAILVPAVFSALALFTATSGVAYGYFMVNQKIAEMEATGGHVSEAERADAYFLLWSTGVQGAVVCGILLAMLLLAILVKRDMPPSAGDADPNPRGD